MRDGGGDAASDFTVAPPLASFSWDEEKLAGGLAGLQIAVGVGGIDERIAVFKAELESAVGYCVEHIGGTGFEVGPGGDVVLQRRTSDVERAHGGEADGVEGG